MFVIKPSGTFGKAGGLLENQSLLQSHPSCSAAPQPRSKVFSESSVPCSQQEQYHTQLPLWEGTSSATSLLATRWSCQWLFHSLDSQHFL